MSVQRQNKRVFSTRVIAFAAVLVALSIVLKRFASITIGPDIRFSLGVVPVLLGGLFGGPVLGASVGAIADLLGMLIGGTGGFHLGLTLTEALRGALPGLIVILFKGQLRLPAIITTCVSELVICSLLLQSLWFSMFTGNPYWVQLTLRVPNSLVLFGVYIVVLNMLVPALKKVLPAGLGQRKQHEGHAT